MNLNSLKPASDFAKNYGVTQLELFEILNYNPYTGKFIWIKSISRRIRRYEKAGSIETEGYLVIKIYKKYYKAHRLAFLYMTGSFPKNDIDHIDLNRINNKWNNLREATRSQNKMNTTIRPDNLNGVKGVTFDKNKKLYRARIQVGDKRLSLGRFEKLEDAAEAYKNAAIKYFGEYARIK